MQINYTPYIAYEVINISECKCQNVIKIVKIISAETTPDGRLVVKINIGF